MYGADSIALREPNLLIPGKRPIGSVRVAASDIKCFLLGGTSSIIELVTGAHFTIDSGDGAIIARDRYWAFTSDEYSANLPLLENLMNGQYTIICRVRRKVNGLYSFGVGATANYWISISQINSTSIQFVYDDNAVKRTIITTGGVTLNEWAYIIIRRSTTNVAVQAVNDGDYLGTWYTDVLGNNVSNVGATYLGGFQGLASPHAGFDLSHLMIFNRGLSDAEIVSVLNDPYQFLIPA